MLVVYYEFKQIIQFIMAFMFIHHDDDDGV